MWKYALAAYVAIHASAFVSAEGQDIASLLERLGSPKVTLKAPIVTTENTLPCEGYLTNNPDQGFCSETVPEDWSAFDFNGDTFYLVPLAKAKTDE